MHLGILMWPGSPWARQTALRLTELGHDIHVIAFSRSGRDDSYLSVTDSVQSSAIASFCKSVAGLHLINSGFSSSLRYLTSAPRLGRILYGCGAEVLLTLYGGGFAAMAYLSQFRPYTVYVVGSDVMALSGLRLLVTRRALASAKIVFVNGTYLAARAREISPQARLVPLLLGVDYSKFSPAAVPATPIKIVCTRGFLPVYNNEYLVRALALIRDSVPNFTVTFVSSGPWLDSVRRLADDLLFPSMRKNVEFLGGVSDDQMVQILRESHVYVSLSRSDGTSISLLEALSCGLFPVLSDIPQNREWITSDGSNGILIPLDKPEELAKGLTRAITEDTWRARAASLNRQLIVERADSHRNMSMLMLNLESVVHKASSEKWTHAN